MSGKGTVDRRLSARMRCANADGMTATRPSYQIRHSGIWKAANQKEKALQKEELIFISGGDEGIRTLETGFARLLP